MASSRIIMHAIHRTIAESTPPVDSRASPERHRLWQLSSDGPETIVRRVFHYLCTLQNRIFGQAKGAGESGTQKLYGTAATQSATARQPDNDQSRLRFIDLKQREAGGLIRRRGK